MRNEEMGVKYVKDGEVEDPSCEEKEVLGARVLGI